MLAYSFIVAGFTGISFTSFTFLATTFLALCREGHIHRVQHRRPSVKRLMMYMQGCFAGGTVLRLAKDLAENNRGSRVLVVCSEITAFTFRGPSDTQLDNLMGNALFGDSAAAVIVGADPIPRIEKPMFVLVFAEQTILPESDGAINGHLREVGLTLHLLKDVPGLISEKIEKCQVEAFQPLGISDWNSLFWIAQPGGVAILKQVEQKLGLNPEKLLAARHVLSEYGNMSSACVLFIMDEMRRRSIEGKRGTTGEGLEWGCFVSLFLGRHSNLWT